MIFFFAFLQNNRFHFQHNCSCRVPMRAVKYGSENNSHRPSIDEDYCLYTHLDNVYIKSSVCNMTCKPLSGRGP